MLGKIVVFGIALILLVSGTTPVAAQEEGRGWVSPGLRLGYRFGDDGGFFLGVECSFMHMFQWSPSMHAVGAVVSVDGFAPGLRFQIGAQYSAGIAGTALGYSYLQKEGKSEHGYFGSLYTFIGIMPYLAFEEYPDRQDGPDIEAGALLKAPLKVYGPTIKIF